MIEKKLDKLWSKRVKEKNRCEYCGTTHNLEAHHIHSRAKKSTRWDLDNGICLCKEHHTISSEFSAHQTPIKFLDWITQKRGKDFMDRLEKKANTIVKLFDFEKKELLKYLK